MEAFRQRLQTLHSDTVHLTDVKFLSDLDRAQAQALREAWPGLPLELRRRLVGSMAELAEENVEYTFSRALKVALHDEDAWVRAAAIAALWEDEGEDFLAYLLDEAVPDADLAVREAAVQALAHFSQLVVEDALSQRWYAPLRAHLLALVRGDDTLDVRRRALEALAVYTDDVDVTREIERAYASDDEELGMSALYAMGRNLDERWLDTIIKEMDNPSPGLRFEATRASGELGDRRAVPALVERLGDDDREVQLAAIGSLGRIGDQASLTILRRLTHSKDDAVREAGEEAVVEASFINNPLGPGGRLDLSES
ncbi:MAG: HEAT repeat domain-containing protein [Thermomicrobiales bacterium]